MLSMGGLEWRKLLADVQIVNRMKGGQLRSKTKNTETSVVVLQNNGDTTERATELRDDFSELTTSSKIHMKQYHHYKYSLYKIFQ